MRKCSSAFGWNGGHDQILKASINHPCSRLYSPHGATNARSQIRDQAALESRGSAAALFLDRTLLRVDTELPELKNRFRGSKGKQELEKDWEQDYFRLGGHPQGFYTIWVSIAHRDEMETMGYPISTRDFPNEIGIASFQTLTIPHIPIEETNTTIRESQIIAASN